MRPSCRLGAVHEFESFREGGNARPVLGIHPGDPGSFVAGHEAGAGQQALQLEVVVTGNHLDRFEPQGIDGLKSVSPDGAKRDGRDTGNDDGIAPPCSTPVRQYDGRNGSLVIDPEEVVDRVRAPRRSPPPLQISGFPYPRLRIRDASALQELRRERYVLEAGGPYLMNLVGSSL